MSAFDKIHPDSPAGFVPIEMAQSKLSEYHWPVDDSAWSWSVEMMSDEELLRRFHNAAAELEARALNLTDAGEIVPRELTQEEIDRGWALAHYWQVYAEIKVRKAVREVLAAVVKEEQ